MYGSGYSAGCRLASIGCASGSYQVAALGGGIALFVLNFILAGIIGGFVLVWRLIVAVWYVPLTAWRLISI